MEKRLEALARIQHEIWSHWMRYQFAVCNKGENGELIIPAEKVERWTRQMETHYNLLSEEEKQSDREVVIQHDIENRLDQLS